MHGSGPNRLFRVAVATVATVARTTQRVASQQAPTIRTHNQPVVPVSMTIELADVENQKRGSEAQGLPLSTQLSSLEWRNVQFQVPVKRTPIDKIKGLPASNKVILSSVNGVAHAGKLTAIMGPSGVKQPPAPGVSRSTSMRRMLTHRSLVVFVWPGRQDFAAERARRHRAADERSDAHRRSARGRPGAQRELVQGQVCVCHARRSAVCAADGLGDVLDQLPAPHAVQTDGLGESAR